MLAWSQDHGGSWSVCKPNFWWRKVLVQFSTTLGPYFAELVCRACGTVCLRRPRFGPMLGAFGTHCRMYGSTLGCVGPIFAHVGPMLVMLGNVGPASGPYCAYLEPFRAALEQGRPANTAGGQHSSSQRSKDTRRAWEKSRDTFWHSSKATNWDTHQTVAQVSQHSSKQTWQEVSQHSSRHSKDTNLGHLGQQPVQQGHPPNTAAFATQPLQQGLILGHRPKQASQCSKDSAWESSQCSKRGQTPGQVSQHSSICRRGMGCPPGMSPQQQQPAPYSLLAGTETASGQQQPPLGSSLPADSQTHGRTNRPTNMGGVHQNDVPQNLTHLPGLLGNLDL